MKGLCVLGATGSIGVSTLDVVARHPEQFRVVALTGNHNLDRLFEQCLTYRPRLAVVVDDRAASELRQRLRAADAGDVEVASGAAALAEAASLPEVDYVMAAIVGAAGLLPTLAAAHAGKRVLLANKEALVMSGRLFIDAIRASGSELLPIDSEHNAIFQCMPHDVCAGRRSAGVRRILLTASGGPFRVYSAEALRSVTPEQAVAHPNWVMGRKISVDSATLMNKGLEVIEAHWLFGVAPADIQVVVHPQSVIHSMVEYIDGSVLAQLGNPDMRVPIAHALAWPDRFGSGSEPLDVFAVKKLEFEMPDLQRFPCLRLAYDAARAGEVAPAVLNAANEIAVAAFLERRIDFTDIPRIVEYSLTTVTTGYISSVEGVLECDRAARVAAHECIASLH